MKHNLKTRPNHGRVNVVGSPDWYAFKKDEEWFRGFEKELRKMRKHHNKTFQYTAEEVFNEILGEGDSKWSIAKTHSPKMRHTPETN
jgi:hypothetical protein